VRLQKKINMNGTIDSTVRLKQSEIERITEVPGVDFHELTPNVQKQVAYLVLMQRADPKSVSIADLIQANNPNIQSYVVIDDTP